ncbi:MAG: isocitrate lyase/PEP mutase family protein [Thiolinea sp.]
MHNKAKQFQQAHLSGETFIMANAWNPGSAVLLAEAGFTAIGTTSAGIAFSHAVPDYEGALSFDAALDETQRIAAAVDVPVSMDAENGYGDSPEAVFANMKRIAATGVVGANIEDYTGDMAKPLYDIAEGAERIRAAKEAVADLDYPFMLTARAECYLTGHADPFKESVERVNRYREAGADCLFVPGIKDLATIRELVQEVDGPVNVVMGLSGTPLTLAELQEAGVARISIGGSLARATFGLVRRAAQEMLEHGTFSYASQQIPDDELCRLFAKPVPD